MKGGRLKARPPGQTRVEEEGTAQQLHFLLLREDYVGGAKIPPVCLGKKRGRPLLPLLSHSGRLVLYCFRVFVWIFTKWGRDPPRRAPRTGQRRLESHFSGLGKLLSWLASTGPCLEDYFAYVHSCPLLSQMQTSQQFPRKGSDFSDLPPPSARVTSSGQESGVIPGEAR